ncbi:MAG TPA: hypothetical protein DD636_06635 [Anaerolineaceae bacterium]|nr:hypothetical protein [Anaerolineaceae bacterium]
MNNLIIHAFIRGAAQNYLDPSSGSIIIQLILGAVLGLGVVVRVFWKKIKAFFTRNRIEPDVVLDPTTIVEVPSSNYSERNE